MAQVVAVTATRENVIEMTLAFSRRRRRARGMSDVISAPRFRRLHDSTGFGTGIFRNG
ncbi:hypothetical protein [Streptosporangium sp. NBC_01469]|uniref:hypothetical protein n=1 Tax=Streptosporangium sp. NBC_01469 TaxID=2903898 RepID=UPI002E2C0FB9|nr:hypothetical protein [Streptosporangium sp. NBC_01469]